MERRIACISLCAIRVEIARSDGQEAPLAVIVARPGSPVQTERNVLGNTRIDCVSEEAARLGVRAGQTVAAARAKVAGLRVRVVPVGSVHTSLARIAEAALAFGPTTAFDVARDVVWVDVTGCARLRGGEVALAHALGARVRELGHACCVAVADGPRLAAALARFSPGETAVVPAGKGAAAVRSLPIAALELDERVSTWLADLGLHTWADLQKLPRRSLGMRLGDRVHDVMHLLDGRDSAPLDPWRPPEVPEERVELDWGAGSIEALTFVLKTLCDRLAVRLHGRAMAAARLELVLSLDRSLCELRRREDAPSGLAGPGPEAGWTGDHRVSLSMVLPSPMARASELLAVVRARLEGCLLAAPVLAVTLRAPELARATARPLDLLEPEPKARRALPLLVAELAAELGEEVVGVLSLVDTWSPVERTRLVAFGGQAGEPRAAKGTGAQRPGRTLVTSAIEPSRLVHATEVPREVLDGARHLARVESLTWWQKPIPARPGSAHGPALGAHEGAWKHDLFAAWVDDSFAWLELRCPGDLLLLRGWMD